MNRSLCGVRGPVLLALAVWASLAPGLGEEVLPGQSTAPRPGLTLARAVSLEQAPSLAPLASGGQPVWTLVRLSWQRLEATAGQVDTSALTSVLGAIPPEAGPVVLEIDADPPAWTRGEVTARRRAWQAMLRAVARAAGGRVDWYLVGGVLTGRDEPSAAAFEIKLASVTLRAEDSGAGVGFRVEGEAGIRQIAQAYAETGDLAPYVDALCLAAPFARVEALAVRLRQATLEADPGISLWAELPAPAGGETEVQEQVLARAIGLFAVSTDLVTFARATGPAAAAQDRVLAALAGHLPEGLSLSPTEGAGIEVDPRGPPLRWVRFFDEKNFQEVVAYWSPGPVEGGTTGRFLFKKVLRRGYRVVDPVTGRLRYARSEAVDDAWVRVEAPLDARPRLLLVTRQKFSPGIMAQLEETEATGTHEITAEEIIAAHQRWRTFQDDRLMSVSRRSEINLRFRYALVTGTIDVTMDTDYFWDRQTGQEWSIREKYVNGVRLKWDKLPELPLINQEQVVQTPLDLNLDKRYSYRRDGEERVEGRDCWRLRFEPLDSSLSLYKGRAWIDKKTGALVKVKTVQTGLEPPLISDEETQVYHPYVGPDGTEYWLPDGIDGQLIYSIQGGNLVVLRKISFQEPKINEPGFYAARDAAYGSKRQMLRQTGEGFKWLTRQPDGTRKVNEEGDTRQLFALAGALKDEGTDGVVPLAGVNYVDLDFLQRKMILNVFFAGALANVSLSKPGVGGSKLDIGVIFNGVAFKATDKLYDLGVEDESQRVRSLTQSLVFNAGYPLGDFFKLRATAGFNLVDYDTADETASDFTLPQDHLHTRLGLELAYDRAGWGILARREWISRSRWKPWGPAGDLVDAEAVAAAKDYTRTSLGFQKSWFLPLFQKIEIGGTWRTGEDLDRFSAFDFGFFGTSRVRGFGGSGIRYDRGAQAQIQYSFNLGDVIRFDAVVDHARVRDRTLSAEMTDHTGVGIAANFVGPWRTLWRLDYGYSLKSDLEAAEGQSEFMLVVLRLW
ncbi:MAG: sigma-E factor regulatory protein RseB domain-containing protein [Acidobacteriota bacterium]|nr:sigma-E factor regulatory protein RseB domain-containing protein [Acidobacteriota bacterium]